MRDLCSMLLTLLLVASVAEPSLAQPAVAQFPQARFAFVIGSDGYDGAPLTTSANDAALVADALNASGFDVTGARNLDSEIFRASFREFVEKVAAGGPGAVAAVYLSGYGVQSDGDNYLVPPGAKVVRDSDLALNAIRISDLLRALESIPNQGKIILLDLAHAGLFATQGQPLAPGLAVVDPASGALIGFNAAPGEVAPVAKPPYGPYAQAIAEMMRQPGLDVNEIMTRVRGRVAELTNGAQVPWHVSKIGPPLVLLERGPDAPLPEVTPLQVAARRDRPLGELPVDQAYAAALERDTLAGYDAFLKAYPDSAHARNMRGILAARREALTWRRALQVNTPNAYWSYQQRYPRGPHAGDARRRLSRLAAAQEPPLSFPGIEYDFGPPPPDEIVYFDAPQPRFYDPGVPPPPAAAFYAPPPRWWRPPPPPVFAEDAHYFLAELELVPAPAWARPPNYVVAPPAPRVYEDRRQPPGAAILPYVTIPAALAAGIVAGRIDTGRSAVNQQQGAPTGPRQRPEVKSRAGKPGARDAGLAPGGRIPFLPPIAAPPAAIGSVAPPTIRLQPGTGAPIRTAPVEMRSSARQLLTTPPPVSGPRPPSGAGPSNTGLQQQQFLRQQQVQQRRQERQQAEQERQLQQQQRVIQRQLKLQERQQKQDLDQQRLREQQQREELELRKSQLRQNQSQQRLLEQRQREQQQLQRQQERSQQRVRQQEQFQRRQQEQQQRVQQLQQRIQRQQIEQQKRQIDLQRRQQEQQKRICSQGLVCR